MNRLTTLGEVRTQVEMMSENHWDDLIPVNNIVFKGLDNVLIHGEEHSIRPIAQRSIAYRLGIPYNYLNKCAPQIQSLNLNYWLQEEKNENLFFRFDGNDVRAIFTPRYTPIDNLTILQKLVEQGIAENTLIQASIDSEFMLLSIPDKEKTFRIKRDDELQPGIAISNSEVGMSSLTISAFVLRLICTNGLISRTSVDSSYRHISTRILEEFPNVLNQVSKDFDDQRRQWQISVESRVDNPTSTLNAFNRQFQLNQKEEEAVDWAWPQERGETMFNIINTYTKSAQYPSLNAESQFRLQRTGGSILAMLN